MPKDVLKSNKKHDFVTQPRLFVIKKSDCAPFKVNYNLSSISDPPKKLTE